MTTSKITIMNKTNLFTVFYAFQKRKRLSLVTSKGAAINQF